MSGIASLLARGPAVVEAVSGLGKLAFGSTGGVVLGDFTFAGFEVPESVPFGGAQSMTVHRLPGGERVVDLMGDDLADISWSGTIMDGNPEARAKQLDQMRSDGLPLPLVFGQSFYSVLIRNFTANVMYGRVGYHIDCLVLVDEAKAQAEAEASAQAVAQGGISGALHSVAGGLQQAADTIHQVVSVAQNVVGQVQNLAAAVGISVPFLAKAQEALGVAGGVAGSIGSVASGLNSTADTVDALSASASASYGGSEAMGGFVSDTASAAPEGSLVSGPDDLGTVTYAAGQQAQMQQAGDQSGAAAVSVAGTSGQSTTDAITASQPANYADPSPPFAHSGPPNSVQDYTAKVVNTSGDPSQALFMQKTTSYDSNGVASVSYHSTPATAGALTAADRKAAGF